MYFGFRDGFRHVTRREKFEAEKLIMKMNVEERWEEDQKRVDRIRCRVEVYHKGGPAQSIKTEGK